MKSKLSALELKTFRDLWSAFCFMPLQVFVACVCICFGMYFCNGYPEVDRNIEIFFFLEGAAHVSFLFLIVGILSLVYYSLAKPADDISLKTE